MPIILLRYPNIQLPNNRSIVQNNFVQKIALLGMHNSLSWLKKLQNKIIYLPYKQTLKVIFFNVNKYFSLNYLLDVMQAKYDLKSKNNRNYIRTWHKLSAPLGYFRFSLHLTNIYHIDLL